MNTDRTVILYGAGDHAKSVIAALHDAAAWELAGLVDDHPAGKPSDVLGHPLLGDASALDAIRARGITKAHVSIGHNIARGKLADMLKDRGFELVQIVHPTAVLLGGCALGEGSFAHALCVIGPDCHVGPNTIIQPYTSLGHDGRIGACVQFCPGVHIGGHVTIGDYAFFGPGAVVYPGVTIGQHASIGANSVIHKDVPDHAVMAGNPARPAKPTGPTDSQAEIAKGGQR